MHLISLSSDMKKCPRRLARHDVHVDSRFRALVRSAWRDANRACGFEAFLRAGHLFECPCARLYGSSIQYRRQSLSASFSV